MDVELTEAELNELIHVDRPRVAARIHEAKLDGDLSEDDAKDLTATLTRKLARRQEAWFRPDPRITWHDATAVATGERPIGDLHDEVHACVLTSLPGLSAPAQRAGDNEA